MHRKSNPSTRALAIWFFLLFFVAPLIAVDLGAGRWDTALADDDAGDDDDDDRPRSSRTDKSGDGPSAYQTRDRRARILRRPAFAPEIVVSDLSAADLAELVEGLDLLAARQVRLFNLSLSGPANRVLARMIDRLTDAQGLDAIIVSAAGNGGPTADPAWPGAHPNVIAVTAVDTRGRIFGPAQRGDQLDLAAPGVNLLAATSIKGARAKSGTSFAVPFVTAAAALLLSRPGPDAGQDVRDRLYASATDLGTPGRLEISGEGTHVDSGWDFDRPMVSNHNMHQVKGNPMGARPPRKFHNFWTITTPPGWSCLFIPPLNRPNGVFEVASAVVDTDTYRSPVHFPFFASAGDGLYVIEKGSPLIQVVTFVVRAVGRRIAVRVG